VSITSLRPPAARRALSVALTLSALQIPAAARSAPVVPANFVVEDIAPGAGWVVPTCVTPMPDGRILVGEKRGRVWIVQNGVKNPTPLWAADAEVLDSYDRGLLSVAVDPHYFVNHFVYFLYTVDPDSNNDETNIGAWGRLTRYQVNFTDSSTVVPSSRTILFGTSWGNGPVEYTSSHTIGTLRWGSDGSLLVSTGDGADFTVGPDAGGLYPQYFGPGLANPADDIGSYRAQYIKSLDGKVLRINPANGHGYPSNPFFNGDETSNQSKVWAYGFRNPFRFCVRPGTGSTNPTAGNPGTIYIGDVGWNDWEEMDVINFAGLNMGWPCYEGPVQQLDYWPLAPSHLGCDSLGIVPDDPNPATLPIADWHHRLDYVGNPPGFIGNTSIGGVFYTDTLYPPQYRGQYFHGDYGQNWIRAGTFSPGNAMLSFDLFGSNMDGPVDFNREPGTGNILYVAIVAQQVRRIRYTGAVGGNTAPVAVATAAPTSGPAPLTVVFDGTGSYDADGDSLTYTWLFGDGTGSTLRNPTHTYTSSGSFEAVLAVDDSRGAEGRDTIPILVHPLTPFPSAPVLDDFNRANQPLGAPWTADVAGLQVQNNTLVQTSGYGFPIWDGGVFGADQEVYITFKTMTAAAPERDLVLKAQGSTDAVAHIEMRYDATLNQVDVGTYDPAVGWLSQGLPIPVTFSAGDQFGARCYANGVLETYKNGTRIDSRTLVGWPYFNVGGRVGLTINAINSGSFDDFGGGDVVFPVDHPPVASILTPHDTTFYTVPEHIFLQATATDPDGPADTLHYHWDVLLHHNNHFHWALSWDGPDTTSFNTIDHDDGTGVYYQCRITVTDKEGLVDSVSVNLFPDSDLSPSAVATDADHLAPSLPTEYSFLIRNSGTLMAHTSHWCLLAGSTMLAQGDTLVLAKDSVLVDVKVPPSTLAPGTYTLRAVVDSLNSVVETDENNNVSLRALVVPNGTTGVTGPLIRELALSSPFPNPAHDAVRLTLDLPRDGDVTFRVHDLQGRVVHVDAERFAAGRWTLQWTGEFDSGGAAPPGVYLATIRAGGRTFIRRIALLR
jgi:glucose/arabinose dehydrogenase/PKD repeat protein